MALIPSPGISAKCRPYGDIARWNEPDPALKGPVPDTDPGRSCAQLLIAVSALGNITVRAEPAPGDDGDEHEQYGVDPDPGGLLTADVRGGGQNQPEAAEHLGDADEPDRPRRRDRRDPRPLW
jgi:hypothetical protein